MAEDLDVDDPSHTGTITSALGYARENVALPMIAAWVSIAEEALDRKRCLDARGDYALDPEGARFLIMGIRPSHGERRAAKRAWHTSETVVIGRMFVTASCRWTSAGDRPANS